METVSQEYASQDRGPPFKAYLIFGIVVSTVAIALRFISRFMSRPSGKHNSRFWWDDWTALGALPAVYIFHILMIEMVNVGMGKHVSIVVFTLVKSVDWTPPIYFFYGAGVALSRASAILFMQRMFLRGQVRPWFKRTLYAIHGLNIAWFIGMVTACFAQCIPAAVTGSVVEIIRCNRVSDLWLGSAVPGTFIDLAILLAPIPLIWSLGLERGKKIGLTVIFICGYSVVAATIARTILCITLRKALNEDMSYEGIAVLYFDATEIPLTIISICLPATLVLAQHVARTVSSFASSISSHLGSRGTMHSMPSSHTGSDEEEDLKFASYNHTAHHNQSAQKLPGYTVAVTGDLESGMQTQGNKKGGKSIYVQNEVMVSTVAMNSTSSLPK